MEKGKHTKFILTPIFEILEECVNATKGVGFGIETYPLCDYIMQTTFLKMTGASEQKLKCILWEIATNDFEFRYKFLHSNYGECSNFEDKKNVFKTLKKRLNTDSLDNSAKNEIKNKATQGIINLFEKSILSIWQEKEFQFFKNEFNNFFGLNHFCNNSNLFTQEIDFEKIVYKHRNRCAHNLKSYQVNLPKLSVLVDKNYDYENYFFRFSILILLDEIFMKIYSKLLKNDEF